MGLTTAMAGSASIVVTHRLSTVRNADHILVLDADRFVERGTHNELSSPGEASTSS
jgi:ABC-type multidrug transport system fused ATPase/permease subunit